MNHQQILRLRELGLFASPADLLASLPNSQATSTAAGWIKVRSFPPARRRRLSKLTSISLFSVARRQSRSVDISACPHATSGQDRGGLTSLWRARRWPERRLPVVALCARLCCTSFRGLEGGARGGVHCCARKEGGSVPWRAGEAAIEGSDRVLEGESTCFKFPGFFYASPCGTSSRSIELGGKGQGKRRRRRQRAASIDPALTLKLGPTLTGRPCNGRRHYLRPLQHDGALPTHPARVRPFLAPPPALIANPISLPPDATASRQKTTPDTGPPSALSSLRNLRAVDRIPCPSHF